MLPYLSIGPYLLQLPGVVLLAGVWFAFTLIEKGAKKQKADHSAVYNLGFYGLVAGLIGSRLVYAARYLDTYLADPVSFVALNPNTLSPEGGLVIGLLVAVLYGRWKRLPLRPTLNILTPGLAVFMIFFAIANFLSGDAFGKPASLPWAIYLWDEYRHPSQIYELLLAGGIFAIILKRPLGKPGAGLRFLQFISLTAAARLFLEAFRGDSVLLVEGLRTAQVIALILMMTALYWIKTWSETPNPR